VHKIIILFTFNFLTIIQKKDRGRKLRAPPPGACSVPLVLLLLAFMDHDRSAADGGRETRVVSGIHLVVVDDEITIILILQHLTVKMLFQGKMDCKNHVTTHLRSPKIWKKGTKGTFVTYGHLNGCEN